MQENTYKKKVSLIFVYILYITYPKFIKIEE